MSVLWWLSLAPLPLPDARQEMAEPHTHFVTRVLLDGVVGVENRYWKPVAGAGVHVAFLQFGRFFVGAPGVMMGSAPEWVDVVTLKQDPQSHLPYSSTDTVLRRSAMMFLTQSVSWQIRARRSGYVYLSLLGTKRLPITDSRWDPAVAISFTPR